MIRFLLYFGRSTGFHDFVGTIGDYPSQGAHCVSSNDNSILVIDHLEHHQQLRFSRVHFPRVAPPIERDMIFGFC